MLVPMVILAASSTARWPLAKLFRLIHHSSFRGFPEVNIEEVTFSLLSHHLGKNSTDMYAISAAFCISALRYFELYD